MPPELQRRNTITPSGLGLFLINCLATTLPVKGRICSSMLFCSEGGSCRPRSLVAFRSGRTFRNLSRGECEIDDFMACMADLSLENLLMLVASQIVEICVAGCRYMRILENFSIPIMINTPRKFFLISSEVVARILAVVSLT